MDVNISPIKHTGASLAPVCFAAKKANTKKIESESSHELLTSEQEFYLGTKVREGLEAEKNMPPETMGLILKEFKNYKTRSFFKNKLNENGLLEDTPNTLVTSLQIPESQRTEALKIVEGKLAQNIFIIFNQRLVGHYAKSYKGRGLSYRDLKQEGTQGLKRAAEKFDPDMGTKFSTYATYWIKQKIKRAIDNQAKTIRIPIHILKGIAKLSKHRRELANILCRKPTIEELATEIGKPIEWVKKLVKAARKPSSLERTIGNTDGFSLLDNIADPKSEESVIELDLLRKALKTILDTLKPRESLVLELRYGLTDGKTRTLNQIGKELKLTKERVRQIQNIALGKLRNPKRKDLLKGFLDEPK